MAQEFNRFGPIVRDDEGEPVDLATQVETSAEAAAGAEEASDSDADDSADADADGHNDATGKFVEGNTEAADAAADTPDEETPPAE